MSKRTSIRPRKFHEDKKLVTDQPGWTVVFVGLAIAFFFGFTLKGLLSTSRIKALVEQAATKVHKDVRVSVGSAQFSLADGWWPQARILINDVRMEADQDCWMNPVLSVDQIELPISFKALIRGQVPFTEVEANDVQLRFKTDYRECETNPIASKKAEVVLQNSSSDAEPSVEEKEGEQTAEADSSTSPSASAKSDSTQATNSKPFIRLKKNAPNFKEVDSIIERVSVRHFLILHQQYPQMPVDLQNLVFETSASFPRKYILKAKTNLIRDQQVNDYMTHANILVEYTESAEQKVEAHIFGNWREGHYSLNSTMTLAEQALEFDIDLKHIPLAKIMPLLKQYGVVKADYNVKEVWLSLKARSSGQLNSTAKASAEITDFKLEGDLGSADAEIIKFKSLSPVVVQPFRMRVDRLNLDRLFMFLNRQKPPTFLGSLGDISGNLEYIDEDNLSVRGLLKGLEFVFSNQGQSQAQKIETVSGELKLTQGRWSAKVEEFRLVDGLMEGRIDLNASKDFRDVRLSAALDDLAFSSAVEKVMTKDGDMGHFSGRFDAKFTSGILAELRGNLKAENTEVQGVLLEEPKFEVSTNSSGFEIRTSMKGLSMNDSSVGYKLFKPLFDDTIGRKISLKSFTSTLHSRDLRDLSWKKLAAQIPERNLQIASEGGWGTGGELFGQLSIRSKKNQSRYLLKGTRDNPQFQATK